MKKLSAITTKAAVTICIGACIFGMGLIHEKKAQAASITSEIETIEAGEKIKLTAEHDEIVCTSEPAEEFKWSVNNTKYAEISKNGVLKAKRAGKVKVSVTDSTGTDTLTIKIKAKKVIAIDAGHQQRGDSSTEPVGPGASTKKAKVAGGTSGVYTRVPEYKLTLSVARKLKKELVGRGYKVVMIRTKHDVNISNKERALKANKTSDICIRIHADGSVSPSVSGASALYPSTSNKYVSKKVSKSSKKLSEKVLSSMCDETGARNRGCIVRDDLTGTNWSTIPVTLIEMGFMSNKTEDIKMQKQSYQNKLAKGMAEGIDSYYGYK